MTARLQFVKFSTVRASREEANYMGLKRTPSLIEGPCRSLSIGDGEEHCSSVGEERKVIERKRRAGTLTNCQQHQLIRTRRTKRRAEAFNCTDVDRFGQQTPRITPSTRRSIGGRFYYNSQGNKVSVKKQPYNILSSIERDITTAKTPVRDFFINDSMAYVL
jgi:hypothetical protein